MSEYTLQLIAFCKLLWIAVFAYLYGLGGIHFKVLRRYVGAAWMALGVFVFQHWQGNMNNWAYVWPVLFFAALTMPYGADTLWKKIILRASYGVCLAASSLVLVTISHLWLLWIYNLILTTVSAVVFGAFNPFKSARDEESNIASVAVTLPMFMV